MEPEPKQPRDPENRIREIVSQINTAERERSTLSDDIKEMKAEALDLGYSKAALAEALRLAKQEDSERNLILATASEILTKCGRAPIDPNVQIV